MHSSKQSPARRHHTVPRFYLSGFSQDDRLGTIRLAGNSRFIQSTRDATVVKDFYTVTTDSGDSDIVERELAAFEGNAAKVFKSIEDGVWPLPPEDRLILGYFITLQANRVPVERNNRNYLAQQVLRLKLGAGGKTGLRKRLERHGQAISDESLDTLREQATGPGGLPIEHSKESHIKQTLTLAESLLPYVSGRPWCLIEFSRRSLLTSDTPVALIPDDHAGLNTGVGYATAWGITFPLSRKKGLLISSPEPLIEANIPVDEVREGKFDLTRPGTTTLARFFNEQAIWNASEAIYHHPEDTALIPSELPPPRPVTSSASSEEYVFSGEPWLPQASSTSSLESPWSSSDGSRRTDT